MAKIWVAMSGGVDSSGAALLMQKTGSECTGVTLSLLDSAVDKQNSVDAAAVCAKLGMAHLTLDCKALFREKVIRYFADSYAAGRTPNPCVLCNREIKLGFLLDAAMEAGAAYVATGHYVRLVRGSDGHTMVRKAADPQKDQSYVLAMLTPAQLRHCQFPLGDYTKDEIRTITAEHGFVTAHKSDSQDICFVPEGDYVNYLTRFTGKAPVGGNYVDEDGKILGKHRGQQCYTIGQRKGLGIALGRHMFVLSKDAATNTVVLGDEPSLFRTKVACGPFHCQASTPLPDGYRCKVKIRYTHKEAPARLWQTEQGCLVEFEEVQRAPSPGQFAVCYEDDVVLGGAEIL